MTYWHYTYMQRNSHGTSFGYGVQMSPRDEFDFPEFHREYPDLVLLSVHRIGSVQYDELNEHLDELRRDGIHE